MSGGYFEYKQYELNAIADSIEQVIRDWIEENLTDTKLIKTITNLGFEAD